MQGLVCDFCSSGQRFARGLVGSPHPASFRFHLAMDTLAFLPRKRSERLGKTDSGGNKVTVGGEAVAFGYILPTTGRIRDFHPLERALAGRTKKTAAAEITLACSRQFCFHISLFSILLLRKSPCLLRR